MGDYTDNHLVVTWELDERVEGISQRLIWNLAVRSRPNWQLDSFLKSLEEWGCCIVLVKGLEGQSFRFPCCLTIQELAA